MQKIFILLVFFCAARLGAQTPDFSLFQKKEYIGKKGDTLRYRVLYPENYDRSAKYPVVLFLHGAGERGSDNEKQLVHGVSLFLKPESRKNYPCIVLAPQCPAGGYWGSVSVNREKMPVVLDFDYRRPIVPDLRLAINLVKQVLKKEGGDRHRVYVTGLSMGGMGTFEAVHRFPKLFAAAAPVCGGGDTQRYSKKAARVPFWVFHGDQDNVVEPRHSREMVERLKALGAAVKYTEYPGVRHDSWNNAYAEPEFLEWLFANKK